jgi:hypothetical protein
MKKSSVSFETALATFTDLKIEFGEEYTACTLRCAHNGRPVYMSNGWLVTVINQNDFADVQSMARSVGSVSFHLSPNLDTKKSATAYMTKIMQRLDEAARRHDEDQLNRYRGFTSVDPMAMSAKATSGTNARAGSIVD